MAGERFVYTTGTISITTGGTSVSGTGTAWSGRDRAGSEIKAKVGGVWVIVGTVAEVDPRGVYSNTSLPLVTAYGGSTITGAAYEMVDGPAIANGATQAAVFARYTAFLENNLGLVGNISDVSDPTTQPGVPNNSLWVDDITRVIYQLRGGVLEPVYTVASPFLPRGAWDSGTSYDANDMVNYQGYVYVSNHDANLNNAPVYSPSPASNSHWTNIPTIGVSAVLAALGITAITISTSSPSGGVEGNLWMKVDA